MKTDQATNATPQALGSTDELGPMPEAVAHVHSDGDFCQDRYYGNSGWPVYLYTADQMHAYARERGHLLEAEVQRAWVEIERLRSALKEIAAKDATGYGRAALGNVARRALKA